jgi:tetratricopeptide (TPR) repeat protein
MTSTTDRESLEAEREFLIRSLDDLDAERAAGNIDDATYDELHADYTARAARVLRQLRDGVDLAEPEPAAPRAKGARRWAPLALIAVFAISLALLLAQSVGNRGPDGTLTGNNPGSTVAASQKGSALQKAVDANPNDYDARIAYARFLLNTDLEQAVVQYDAAAKLAPKQPEPLAYGGWIRGLVAGQLEPGSDRTLLTGAALDKFAKAIEVAPKYEDTYVFRGITKMRVVGDVQGAIPDFQRFLQLAPADHPQRELVLGALAQAEKATGGASTTVPPTTRP